MRAYRKRRYSSKINRKKTRNLLLLCIVALILIIPVKSLSHEIQIIHIAREAKSQSVLVKTGFEQDEEKIIQRDKAMELSKLLVRTLGKPYIYGGNGPNSFDCSGLVRYVFSEVEIDLPRMAQEQACFSTSVEEDYLRFGDIVFFSIDGDQIDHVGIYIGNGYFEHAPKPDDVVKISSLHSKYYRSSFRKAVRILS